MSANLKSQRIEKLIHQALQGFSGDRYKLALAVAKRSKDLINGSPCLLDIDTKKLKYADIAILEIAQGKISLEAIIESKK